MPIGGILPDHVFVAECRAAREASRTLKKYQPDSRAWVYIFSTPAGIPHFGTRFGIRPENGIPTEPGLTLLPVAAFKDGRCLYSTRPDIVEPEAERDTDLFFFRNGRSEKSRN